MYKILFKITYKSGMNVDFYEFDNLEDAVIKYNQLTKTSDFSYEIYLDRLSTKKTRLIDNQN